nr:MAG TPA: hypothetical protein [Caudoviricetes sp.]
MGLRAGLTKWETLTAMPGEIQDLCACMAICNGSRQKISLSFDEAIEAR